jgi:hypothetical protein
MMKTVYAVGAIPVRDVEGLILGWVRADPLADGTEPTHTVIFRDGLACGQADGSARLSADPRLLYSTRAEAVRGGLARLRKADAAGDASQLA